MTRFLYDTAVFVYAVGAPHPYRPPCREIVDLAATRRLVGEASADLVQEFLHRRWVRTRDRAKAVRDSREVAGLCKLHPLRPDDVMLALRVYEASRGLNARDAAFAAVALNRGIEVILSPDRHFDEVPGLRRVDPADSAAVAALAAAPPG